MFLLSSWIFCLLTFRIVLSTNHIESSLRIDDEGSLEVGINADDGEQHHILWDTLYFRNYISLTYGEGPELLEKQKPDKAYDCAFYSLFHVEYGMLIYSGRPFRPGDIIEDSVGIVIPVSSVEGTSLGYFVEGFNDTYNRITLGNVMIMFHASSEFPELKTMDKLEPRYPRDLNLPFSDERSMYADTHYVAIRDIEPGEHMFADYGDDWFSNLDMEEVNPYDKGPDFRQIPDLDELRMHPNRMPGCAASLTQLMNGRMYATRDIKKGSYVEISRLILLPVSKVHGVRPLEQFVWHSRLELSKRNCQFHPLDPYTCHEEEQEEDEDLIRNIERGDHFVALPLLTGSLYQAPRPLIADTDIHNTSMGSDEGGKPSLEYFWWHVKEGNEFGRVDGLPEDLGEKYFPDWRKEECPDLMFVAFVAARDIKEGEELTINLIVDNKLRRYADQEFSSYCL